VIQKDQSTAFVEIGAGIAVFGAGLVWSWIEKKRKAKAQAAAVAMVATPAAGTTPQ
jgi:3-methyladenine DNA glycosylase Tag